jgi:hypothetical protein
MMVRFVTLAVSTLSVGAVLLAAPPAFAAHDTTPPRLRVAVTPAVGSQIEDWDAAGTADPSDDYTTVPFVVSWSVSEPAGVCGYDLSQTYPGADPDEVLTDTTATSYLDTLSNYDGTFGGGSVTPDGWQVVANGCAGTSTTVGVVPLPTVVQETGRDDTGNYYTAPRLRYWGKWKTSHCQCASGGSQQYTTARGAWVKVTGMFAADSHAALVMAAGPGRGKAKVLVDGTYAGTVDTFAPANVNRTIYRQRGLSAGRHVIKLVNKATKHHARIDLDAVVVTSPVYADS